MRRHLAVLFGFSLLAVPAVLSAQSDPASTEFFETKIRPVLATNCYTCHNATAEGGLRLDSAEGVAKGGESGKAIVAGDPDKSLLITAIRQTDPGLKMPLGGKLSDQQIADFEAWVKAGGNYPKTTAAEAAAAKAGKYVISPAQRQLWSLQPLKSPPIPDVKDPRFSKTPIDRFVFAKMEEQGLKPVAQASKRDLIRRATLDLTGLPPTIEEIDAFEKDTSADAFPKLVDRLLASPAYGERWGRAWLDVARFGEDDYRSLNGNPKGYRPYPNAYAYRDWVIQAFNDDLPYDQFVKAQLAGDLMDPKTRYKTLPATGFLGLGPWYYDNGSNEVTRADERHDRVDVVTRGFLGLTVACARCHDHKYDPIPQTDYYSLAGVFFNTIYEEYPTAPKNIVDEYEKTQTLLDQKNKELNEVNTALGAELARSFAFQTSEYLQGVWDVSPSGKKEKGAVVESRKLDYEVLDRWIKYMEKPTTKYHNKDAWQAMMKSKNGGTAAEAKRLADKFQEELIEAMLAKEDLDAQNQVIKDKDIEGTKAKKRTDKPSNFVSNRDFNPGSWLRLLSLPEEQGNFYTEVFQREIKDVEDPNADAAAGGGRQAAGGVLTFRGFGLSSRIPADPRTKPIQDDIDAARKKLAATKYPFIHGVKDSETPVNIPLAKRGDPMNLGDEVPRHFLSILSDGDPKPFAQGSGRLELAEDIVKQPIAMRVFVNRIWKQHFDTGIVDTPSNFGQKGEAPTNPALLEYLADTFVKNGMSVKKLQRAIMLTQVYQLSTQNNDANYAKDQGDRYYWRANHHRLDAEELRDSVLAVAGNLDLGLGGPSEDLTPANLRRTVYGKVSRSHLDSYLSTFDFPIPNISAEKRFITTVPLQRLFLMNSDFMQIESEALANRVLYTEPNNTARIKKVYQLAFGRLPTDQEIQIGVDYLAKEPMVEYEENKNKPPEAATGGGGRGGRGGGGGKGGGGKGGKGGGGKGGGGAPVTAVDPAAGDAPAGAEVADNAGMGDGMMGGVFGGGGGGGGGGFAGGGGKGGGKAGGGAPGGRGGGGGAAPSIKYEPTAWGRYVKTLLSSSEFLFVN